MDVHDGEYHRLDQGHDDDQRDREPGGDQAEPAQGQRDRCQEGDGEQQPVLAQEAGGEQPQRALHQRPSGGVVVAGEPSGQDVQQSGGGEQQGRGVGDVLPEGHGHRADRRAQGHADGDGQGGAPRSAEADERQYRGGEPGGEEQRLPEGQQTRAARQLGGDPHHRRVRRRVGVHPPTVVGLGPLGQGVRGHDPRPEGAEPQQHGRPDGGGGDQGGPARRAGSRGCNRSPEPFHRRPRWGGDGRHGGRSPRVRHPGRRDTARHQHACRRPAQIVPSQASTRQDRESPAVRCGPGGTLEALCGSRPTW